MPTNKESGFAKDSAIPTITVHIPIPKSTKAPAKTATKGASR